MVSPGKGCHGSNTATNLLYSLVKEDLQYCSNQPSAASEKWRIAVEALQMLSALVQGPRMQIIYIQVYVKIATYLMSFH